MIGLPAWVYTFIILTVTGVWAVLNLLDLILANYTVPAEVQITMGTVAGAALGGQVITRRGTNG